MFLSGPLGLQAKPKRFPCGDVTNTGAYDRNLLSRKWSNRVFPARPSFCHVHGCFWRGRVKRTVRSLGCRSTLSGEWTGRGRVDGTWVSAENNNLFLDFYKIMARYSTRCVRIRADFFWLVRIDITDVATHRN